MEMKNGINLRYLSAALSAGNSSYLCWKMLRMDARIILAWRLLDMSVTKAAMVIRESAA